jgi:pimeloyl-ACP methyl ester carboxylesterase
VSDISSAGMARVAPGYGKTCRDSVAVGGPSSMSRHVADMIAVLDHLGLAAVHVCGMSMGGFVAVELATAYPDRVKSLILVDGGFPMAAPAGSRPDAPPVVFRDRLARLDREWPSVRDYAEFFVAQTAPLLDYLAHDLAGRRVRLSADALVADGADIFFRSSKWQQLQVPVRLLAPSGIPARTARRPTPPAWFAVP